MAQNSKQTHQQCGKWAQNIAKHSHIYGIIYIEYMYVYVCVCYKYLQINKYTHTHTHLLGYKSNDAKVKKL